MFSTWLLIVVTKLPGQLASTQIRTIGVKLFLIHYSTDSVQDIDSISR